MQRPQSETVILNDILITEELSRRSPRPPNLQAENQALHTLARQMVTQPETMLQSLVDIALDLCSAGTAGVSLLETTANGEAVFRWNVSAGTLAQYVGGTAPRNFSPCGVCLERGTPQLFSHPERYFTYFQAANTPIVESLVLPLMADSHVLGTIWIASHDQQRHFDLEDVRIMTSLADFTAATLLLNQRQTRELLSANAALEAEIVERKQAEVRSRALISNLPGGAAFVVDRNLRYLLAEGEALAIAGFKPEDFVGHTIFEMLAPELATDYEVNYRKALAGEPFEHEHYAHGHTYVSRGTPLWAENGEIYAVLAVSYDVTERKRAEAALRESEERFRLFVTASSDIVYRMSADWREMLSLTGKNFLLDTDNPSQTWIETYIPSEEQPRVWATIQEAIRTKSAFELEHQVIQRDGAIGWTFSRAIPLLNEQGDIVEWFGAASDVTNRKQAEVALRESESRLAVELADAKQLQFISSQLVQEENIDALYGQILEAAIALMRSEMGSMQLLHPDRNELQLLAWKGFDPASAAFWQWVRVDSDSTCGVALRTGERAIVPDVETCEFMAGSGDLDSYRRSGVRAVQTTPLISRSGRVVGMISTHWQEPHQPSERELGLLDVLARQAADLIEQRQAEEALRESEAKYRSLFDSIDAGFCIFEMLYNDAGEAIDFRYIETNPAFERQSGRRPQPGQTMRELFPEAEDMWLKDYAEVARTGQAKRFIDYHEDLDRWFDVFVFPTSNGKSQLAALFSDVTDEKRSEAALRESEERLQKAISIETVGVLFFTLDGRITDANDTFLRMSGYSLDEARNIADWQELTPPEFWDVTSCAAEELATLGKTAPYEKQHIRKDGSRWWGLFAPTRLKGSGRNAECVEFVIDISDRKRVEDERKRTEEQQAFLLKFSDTLRAEPDADSVASRAVRMLAEHLHLDRCWLAEVFEQQDIATIGWEYHRPDLPPTAGIYRLSDYPEIMRQIATQPMVIHDIASDPDFADSEKALLAQLQIQALLVVSLRKGQHQVIWALVSAVATPRHWNESERVLLEQVSERTWAAIERARAEVALRESELQRVREQSAREQERQRAESLGELDRAKTLFFSNVSHEFRTPLTLSLAPLQDALSDRAHPFPPIHRERLELAHRNSLRLLKLVNTLLDFSRIEAGRMEAVYESTDLAMFTTELASVFRSAIERAGLRLIVDCPPLPESVYVDREMWEKIVLNLLSNAFKFTFAGEIAVRLHRADNHQVILEVQDTGTGIAPEHLPHLFERFYQVRGAQARTHEGSGIGLALVRELIQLHGGTIDVRSIVGEGTCFAIAIPFGTEHLPSDRLRSDVGDRNSATRTLASTAMGAAHYVEEAERWLPEQGVSDFRFQIADSNKSEIYNLKSKINARVLLVDDNADIRDYLTRILSEYVQVEAVADGASALAAAQERVPDLILSDVMMPGLDGFQLLQALRTDPRTREVPIILLSARAGEEAVVEGLEAGADDYLIKPFSAQELVSRVNAHLQIARLRRESLDRERTINRRKDELLSTVSHELNTPLVAILGWTRLLRANPPSQAMLMKSLDTIERNATLQAKLVQDLLDISRITAGKLRLSLQSIKLKSVIEMAIAAVETAAIAKDIHLELKVESRSLWEPTEREPGNVSVLGDRDRLQQVICNLLTNAIKFTPESGSVTVELSALDDENSPDTSYVQIRVIDTGIGIAANFLPHVFERFRQAKDSDSTKGLGLGLAIAQHLVELHNGTINAESSGEGQGATFIVRLPLLK